MSHVRARGYHKIMPKEPCAEGCQTRIDNLEQQVNHNIVLLRDELDDFKIKIEENLAGLWQMFPHQAIATRAIPRVAITEARMIPRETITTEHRSEPPRPAMSLADMFGNKVSETMDFGGSRSRKGSKTRRRRGRRC